MRTDIVDLRDFYRSNLGQAVTRLLVRSLRKFWPDLSGMTVVGFGYAPPVLAALTEAERALALMPATQGVVHWRESEEAANRSALVEEVELPLADMSVDRLILMHAVETADALRPMLREAWRVLAPNGRLLVIVPNRRGIWSRREGTPFGNGRPYSRLQLKQVLRGSQFAPYQAEHVLYLPPVRLPVLLRAADAWEHLGRRVFPRFGGVIMVDATKEVYSGLRNPAVKAAPARRPVRALPAPGWQPLPAPHAASVSRDEAP